MKENWIMVWVVISIFYAGIIQFLFSFTTSNRFLEAHWGAGDILTYASTVSLGLLALWQNKKIQEANDISQEKLENIIIRSNDLNIILKIVEHEERRLNNLQEISDNFMQNCDPQALAIALIPNEKIKYLANITVLERRIDESFIGMCRLLAEDKKLKENDQHSLKKSICVLYQFAKEKIGEIQRDEFNISDRVMVKKVADILAKLRDDFIEEKEKYIADQRKRIDKILFENLSLEEVRGLFH